MASKALEQILGHMPLTEALRATASGVPNPFPDEFFKVMPKNRILGDRAKYIRITGERRTAKLAKYGAPAVRRNLRDISDQTVRLLHTYESFPVDMMLLQKLRAFEQYVQDEGIDFLSYQIEEAGKRAQNTRIISVASTLATGNLYWDGEGNMLPTSSGAIETYTFNIPATHQNQCNGCISASWALHTTDIPGDIRALQQFAVQETGLHLNACMYGINVPKYISQNAYSQSWLARNPAINEKYVNTGEIPDGTFGIKKWIPCYTTFMEDSTGTNQLIWPADLAVFVPNVDQPDKMTWWQMYEGSFPVPRRLEIQTDAMAALNNFETVYGQAGYAMVQVSPPGMEVFTLDTWLPGLRNEKAIYQAVVAF